MSRTHSRGGCISELCIRVGAAVVVVGGCVSSADGVRTDPILVSLMVGGVEAFAGEFGDDECVGLGDGVGEALNDDLFEVGGGWGESYWAGGGFGDMVDKGEEGGGECSEAVG